MKKLIFYCLLFCCSLTVLAAQGTSYVAFESNSGKVLFSQNAEARRPVSSLAQVATALVALDWVERTKVSLNQPITVPQEAYAIGGAGNPMHLKPGDRITLRDALYSSILGPDNVSALSIAAYVGRDLSFRRSGGSPISLFVNEMNNLAAGLGMKRTKFHSPHGMDAGGSVSESCAVDMALLGSYAMQNAAFAFITKQASRRIGVETLSAGPQYYDVVNTNAMLTQPGIDGIKTGHSTASGPCLLVSGTRNARPIRNRLTGSEEIYPQRIVIAILGAPSSQERYTIAKNLFREGWRTWDAWAAAGMPHLDEKEFLSFPAARQQAKQ